MHADRAQLFRLLDQLIAGFAGDSEAKRARLESVARTIADGAWDGTGTDIARVAARLTVAAVRCEIAEMIGRYTEKDAPVDRSRPRAGDG